MREMEKSWVTCRFLVGKIRREVVQGERAQSRFGLGHVDFEIPRRCQVRDVMQISWICNMLHQFPSSARLIFYRSPIQYVRIIPLYLS